MTKLLYIPSGELILFIAELGTPAAIASNPTNKVAMTPIYEDSLWARSWNDSIDEVICQFCKQDSEITSKMRHKIPTGVVLSSNEFEIIHD